MITYNNKLNELFLQIILHIRPRGANRFVMLIVKLQSSPPYHCPVKAASVTESEDDDYEVILVSTVLSVLIEASITDFKVSFFIVDVFCKLFVILPTTFVPTTLLVLFCVITSMSVSPFIASPISCTRVRCRFDCGSSANRFGRNWHASRNFECTRICFSGEIWKISIRHGECKMGAFQ